VKIPKLGVTRKGTPRIVEDTKVLLRVGSLLKSYDDKGDVRYPTYGEKKAMRPTDLGWARVDVEFTKKGKGSVWTRTMRVSF
jgi:hypothetical protein